MLEDAGLAHPATPGVGSPQGGVVGVLLDVEHQCLLVAFSATRQTHRVVGLVEVVHTTFAQPAER